ncbi:MAG: pirin family protein, partial [Gammaproteobacteria bacterium]
MQLGGFPLHPHSGIATLTYLIEGEINYEDTTGKNGVLPTGGVEWMMAGGGVWHAGGPRTRRRVMGFQLWVALPPALESAPARSIYLSPEELQQVGPARVLLGSYGGVSSSIPAPSPMNYLSVQLKAGEAWRYEPPRGHAVAWIALSSGTLSAQAKVNAGEMVVFEESNQAIDFRAESDAVFVLGSAAKHPHELVLGHYSVHTSEEALRQGEAGIRQIAQRLREEGRLRQ